MHAFLVKKNFTNIQAVNAYDRNHGQEISSDSNAPH